MWRLLPAERDVADKIYACSCRWELLGGSCGPWMDDAQFARFKILIWLSIWWFLRQSDYLHLVRDARTFAHPSLPPYTFRGYYVLRVM